MKVAILGTENSHAYAFAKLMKESPKYADMELIGVYGYDRTPSQKIVDEGYTDTIADNPEDFLGKADAVIITARHGDLHYEYAMPYIKAGVPMFVDKPFTVKPENAKEMIETARQTGALLCGGSSLKFLEELKPLRRYAESHTVVGGNITAPVNMVNEYGGFYFYAQHLIEMLFATFGPEVKSVYAACKDTSKNRLNVIFSYEDFDVTAQYYDSYIYTAAVYAKEGAMSTAIEDVVYCYDYELGEFAEMVRTGKAPHDYELLMRPVTLLAAIERSYTEQKKVDIAW